MAFTWPRLILLSMRRNFEARVGRVAILRLGGSATLCTRRFRRCRASARFISRLRCCQALMTRTPSRVMRRSWRANRRAFTACGSEDAAMSKRRCTALDTLLTFCPPAPAARTAVISTSDSRTSRGFGAMAGYYRLRPDARTVRSGHVRLDPIFREGTMRIAIPTLLLAALLATQPALAQELK